MASKTPEVHRTNSEVLKADHFRAVGWEVKNNQKKTRTHQENTGKTRRNIGRLD